MLWIIDLKDCQRAFRLSIDSKTEKSRLFSVLEIESSELLLSLRDSLSSYLTLDLAKLSLAAIILWSENGKSTTVVLEIVLFLSKSTSIKVEELMMN